MVALNLTCCSRCTIGFRLGGRGGATNRPAGWAGRRAVIAVPKALLARPTAAAARPEHPPEPARSDALCQIRVTDGSSRCNSAF